MIIVEKYIEWKGNFGDPESSYIFAGIFDSMENIPDEIKNAKIECTPYFGAESELINLYTFKEIELNKIN